MLDSIAALDWLGIAVLAVSLWMGAWRGLVVEVISVASWVAAFFLAQWFGPQAAQWLPMDGAGDALRTAAGFALVFVAAVFAGGLLGFVLSKLMAAVGLRPIDRLLGAAFGVLRGAVLLLAVVVVLGMTPVKHASAWQASVGVRWAQGVLVVLKPLLPETFGTYLN